MKQEEKPSERDLAIARILRPLGTLPMSKSQAQRAAQLLEVHWTSVYRLRKRYLEDRVASSLSPRPAGPREGSSRLDPDVDRIIRSTFTKWFVRQKNLGHPVNDLTAEIRRLCHKDGLPKPSRHTIARRWKLHSEEVAMKLTHEPEARIPPGHLISNTPLEIVKIDHTQADAFVVDDSTESLLGALGCPLPLMSPPVALSPFTRPWNAPTPQRPNAATVALLLTRVAFPKAPWIESLGLVDLSWPMHGIPQSLHLDNAAEFKSKALRTGCAEYGITLTYLRLRTSPFKPQHLSTSSSRKFPQIQSVVEAESLPKHLP